MKSSFCWQKKHQFEKRIFTCRSTILDINYINNKEEYKLFDFLEALELIKNGNQIVLKIEKKETDFDLLFSSLDKVFGKAAEKNKELKKAIDSLKQLKDLIIQEKK